MLKEKRMTKQSFNKLARILTLLWKLEYENFVRHEEERQKEKVKECKYSYTKQKRNLIFIEMTWNEEEKLQRKDIK